MRARVNAMKKLESNWLLKCALTIAINLAAISNAQSADQFLREGVTIRLDGHAATIKKLDALPYVESDYTKRFKFDSFENPKLIELRERYYLDVVTASG